MLQDFERGRPLEIEPILGAVVELAERYRRRRPRVRARVRRAARQRCADDLERSDEDIAELSGVGPKTAPLFRELGIERRGRCSSICRFVTKTCAFRRRRARLGESGGEENAVGRSSAVKERRVRQLEIVELRCATTPAASSSRSGSDATPLRLRPVSRGDAPVRSRPRRAHVRRPGRQRRAVRALGEDERRIAASWCRSIARARIWQAARSPPW